MTTDDPNRRPRTAYVLGDVVIARRQLAEALGPTVRDDLERARTAADAVEALIDDALLAMVTHFPGPLLRERVLHLAADLVEWVEDIDERTDAAQTSTPVEQATTGPTWAQAQGGTDGNR